MSSSYTTRAGEHWDSIAKTVYGDELHADWLMSNNLEHIDVFRFSAGTVVYTPPLPSGAVDSATPPWRR